MILIDMQMPKVCDDCPFMDEDHSDYPYCIALGQNRGYTFRIREKRFPNCPLMPVEELKADESETAKLKDMCRVLFNRCRAVGSAGGAMCVFCGIKDECREMHSK